MSVFAIDPAPADSSSYRRPKIKSRLGAYNSKSRLAGVKSRFVVASKPIGRAVVTSRRANPRAIRRAPIRFVEVRDPYTRTEGLAKLFADTPALRDSAIDITANVVRGDVPLAKARLLVVGSFAMTSGGVRRGLTKNARAIEKFVRTGGTVVVLAQTSADDARTPLLPRGLTASRGEATYDELFVGPSSAAKRHRLWSSPNRVSVASMRQWVPDEPKWDYPASLRAVTHAFKAVDGFAILAARDEAGRHPAIIEAAVGKGRVILAAIAPDKLVTSTKEPLRKDAASWLQNVVAYADRVADGHASRVAPEPRVEPGQVAVEAHVRSAATGAAIPGVAVTDGVTFVSTDANGIARFTFADDSRAVLSVVNPPGTRVSSSPSHRVLALVPSKDPIRVTFDLAPVSTPEAADYTFAVISDVHLGARDVTRDGDTFRQRLLELWASSPRPEFIVSLGDVTAYAKRNEFEAYMAITASTRPAGDNRAVISTLGNHDETLGPDRAARFEEFVGPTHTVFHRGSDGAVDRFIVGYDLPGSPERRAWLLAALALAPKPRNIFILQHHNPSRALVKLVRGKVAAVLSGDWHTSRITREAGGVLSINTGPFNFGGLDQTPAGFRLVSVRGARDLTTRVRTGLIERRAEIVEPSAPASCRRGVLPIMVSAYDSRAPVARASYRIASGDRELATGDLSPFGNSLWRGAWDCEPSTRLSTELTVTVEDVRGNRWSARRAVLLESSEIRVASVWLPRFRRGPVEAIAPPISLAWIASTGAEGGVSQPTVAGDLILVGRAEREDVNWSRGALLAFDRSTGEHRWTFHADASIESSPAADDRAAYVTSVRGVMTAVRLADGKPLWKFDMNHASRAGLKYDSRIVYQSPIVAPGAVITGVPQQLVRLSPANGRPDWFATAIGSDHLPNFARTAVSDRRLYVPSYTDGLHVLDLLSGATLWRTARARIMATPLVVGELVVVIDQKYVRALSTLDGRERWRAHLGHGHHSAGAVGHDETVFVPDVHGTITAFRAKDGRKLWSTRVARKAIADIAPYLRRDSGTLTATPALSGATLFVGGHDGVLTAVDTETGRVLARRTLGSPIVASPVISGEMIYVATQAGSLFAFRGTPSDPSPTFAAKKNGKKRNGPAVHRVKLPRRPRS
ncbi:MAG: PQQ-binding-like beta-propeller repeat protein [Deltaproteobacteria bacterium]|nr:PQQ-binding-like beta-propeller repeat protein [Deltaproteobacteria bacterium]